MAFSSDSSKAKAKATLGKLFENVLPGTTLNASSLPTSSTQTFAREMAKKRLTRAEIKKANKIEKVKQNRTINKRLSADKKFNKLVKYNVIKAHKNTDSLTPEEQKYLLKLIKKNSNAVKRADVDDPFVQEEINDLRNEIMTLTNEKYDRSKDRRLESKLQSFNDKVEKGVLAYPGLTPGLAPVGLDSDEE